MEKIDIMLQLPNKKIIFTPTPKPKPKQARFLRRFYIDARIDPMIGEPIFYLLGEDNDDLTLDISWDSASDKNVLGRRTVKGTISEENVTFDIFYARHGDDMALLLQHFHATDARLDKIKRNFYMAKIDSNGITMYAYRQAADIKLISVGGPAENADNLAFELTLSGSKKEMSYDFATGTFDIKIYRLYDNKGRALYDSLGRALYVI